MRPSSSKSTTRGRTARFDRAPIFFPRQHCPPSGYLRAGNIRTEPPTGKIDFGRAEDQAILEDEIRKCLPDHYLWVSAEIDRSLGRAI
jgi:hypothetical protein